MSKNLEVLDVLHNPRRNKDTAFTEKERDKYKLRGLLPPKIEDIETQAKRCLEQFNLHKSPLDKYIFLYSLKNRNETLFFYFLQNNLETVLPIVYTPTVGEACQKYGHIWRTADGMYFSKEDQGHFCEMIDNWMNKEVDIIVVTDGSRILGLGDLGANGMGIPVGKMSLYIGVGGFSPDKTLPMLLDVGTNNEKLLKDNLYLGSQSKRVDDKIYFQVFDELIQSVHKKWPNCLIQFEDISHDHVFDLLHNYQDKVLCFNDDIQGTGAVVAAGFMNSIKISNLKMEENKFVIVGAGSAGIGVADALVKMMQKNKIKESDAIKKIFLTDSKGLLTKSRNDLTKEKQKYAREDTKEIKELFNIVKEVKPTVIIGLSGSGKLFDEKLIKEMAKNCERPVIFALSNPIENSECTAQEAYEWTNGKAIFASGSPFEPVQYNGKTFRPGQGNNMYIFPGLGYGASLCKAKKVSDGMIAAAATALADYVSEKELSVGNLYPPVAESRNAAMHIAAAVIECAITEGLAQKDFTQGKKLLDYVKESVYNPLYKNCE